jgi:hypothetical protein
MGHELESESGRTRDLHKRIDAAIASIERVISGEGGDESAFAGFSHRYREKLGLVRALVDAEDALLVPGLDPQAPRGHSCPEIEESLALPRGGGLETLDELAHLGILKREFLNKINLCPRCERCQINFRETCPTCESLDLDVERILHHFACAYQGLESEFQQGLELVCPKCHLELRQLGQDFERPHEVYVCRDHQHVFEEPEIQGQCLSCAHVFPGTDIRVERIHSYRPTHLAVRAVELNRLTGLDVSEILYDANLKLASRDFLAIEIRRELVRIGRYGVSFVTASLRFEADGRPVNIFSELSTGSLKMLGELLVDSLRTLDLVARTGKDELGLLLIETDDAGAAVVGGRVFELLEQMELATLTGQAMRPVWRAVCWDDGKTPAEEVLAFYPDEGIDE